MQDKIQPITLRAFSHPWNKIGRRTLFSAICGLISQSAFADVQLPALFSDHLVLQKSDQVPVWGTADAGEKVTVSLDGIRATTTAGADGKWKAVLDLNAKGPGPYEMIVEGKNRLAVADVVVGEVWLCSGQSNMEMRLANSLNGQEESAASANPMLREFRVDKKASPVPLDSCEGKWQLASPETSKNFSGVGYYFGKTVQQRLKVPVGLVNASWGGSALEAWTSKEALETDPDLKAGREKVFTDVDTFASQEKQYLSDYPEWAKRNAREDRAVGERSAYAAPKIDTSDWKPVTLPAASASLGLSVNGAVWFRRTVTLDATASNEGWIQIRPGRIGGFHEVYWDGVKVGETIPGKNLPDTAPKYRVSGKTRLTVGEHTLAIRVFTPSGQGGFLGGPGSMMADPLRLKLNGEWLAKVESALPPLDAAALASVPKSPSTPLGVHLRATYLFNGMLNPVIPFAIRGTVWYQGESNGGRGLQYQTTFPLMIRDWRARWQRGDFDFYFCQLANYGAKKDLPEDDYWPELREAQSKTLALPNTGQAVLIDTGAAEDIHPSNRKDQGERLAFVALAKTYGQKIAYSGPAFQSFAIEGSALRIRFDHTDGDLVARPLPATYLLRYLRGYVPLTATLKLPSEGSELQGFALCGADRQWHWAQAKIDGETVVVSSSAVPQPVAVRYAWAGNPTCNLYNGAGFPASPFRTDDFPPIGKERYSLTPYP